MSTDPDDELRRVSIAICETHDGAGCCNCQISGYDMDTIRTRCSDRVEAAEAAIREIRKGPAA